MADTPKTPSTPATPRAARGPKGAPQTNAATPRFLRGAANTMRGKGAVQK